MFGDVCYHVVVLLWRDLLFEGSRIGVLRHYVMQRLHTDVDDATELILDHTETHKEHTLSMCVCVHLYMHG